MSEFTRKVGAQKEQEYYDRVRAQAAKQREFDASREAGTLLYEADYARLLSALDGLGVVLSDDPPRGKGYGYSVPLRRADIDDVLTLLATHFTPQEWLQIRAKAEERATPGCSRTTAV